MTTKRPTPAKRAKKRKAPQTKAEPRATKRKTPQKNANPAPAEVTAAIEMIPQPHGGALLAVGIPGHRGAGGRPRNDVRLSALAGTDEGIALLREYLAELRAEAERLRELVAKEQDPKTRPRLLLMLNAVAEKVVKVVKVTGDIGLPKVVKVKGTGPGGALRVQVIGPLSKE